MSSFSNSLLVQCSPSSSDPSCVPLLPVNRNTNIRKGCKPVPTTLCCRDLCPVEDLLSLWTRSSFVFIHGFTFCKDEFGTFQRCFYITPCVLFFDLMKIVFFSFFIDHMTDVENCNWRLFVLEEFDMYHKDFFICFICKLYTDGSWEFSLSFILPHS